MKTFEAINGMLTDPSTNLTEEDMLVVSSKPFKLLCWNFDQLRKAHDLLRSQYEDLQRRQPVDFNV